MKTWKCPVCWRESEEEDNITFIQCVCGYEMDCMEVTKDD